MEMHEIRYFLAVSNTLHFTRAAEQCNVSQPALTRAIKGLEDKLGGGPLIHRERDNTRSIHELYGLAQSQHDYATVTMLSWFVEEQVEEEQWCEEALSLLEMAGDNRSALLMLDDRYGQNSGTGAG